MFKWLWICIKLNIVLSLSIGNTHFNTVNQLIICVRLIFGYFWGDKKNSWNELLQKYFKCRKNRTLEAVKKSLFKKTWNKLSSHENKLVYIKSTTVNICEDLVVWCSIHGHGLSGMGCLLGVLISVLVFSFGSISDKCYIMDLYVKAFLKHDWWSFASFAMMIFNL